jgi:hypothetical protein
MEVWPRGTLVRSTGTGITGYRIRIETLPRQI